MASRTRSVSTQIGCAVPTVTPWWATSSRKASPNASTPAFDAQYAASPGATVNDAADATSR